MKKERSAHNESAKTTTIIEERGKFEDTNPGLVRSFQEFKESYARFQEVDRQFQSPTPEESKTSVGAYIKG